MTRRAIALTGIPAPAEPAPEPYYELGQVDIARHRALERSTGQRWRVLLDGVDVTDCCIEAHDADGWVILHHKAQKMLDIDVSVVRWHADS